MSQARIASVILPTFNEEKTLPVLIARLQKILPKPYEILVIDDHSRDRTQERVLRLREKDKHIRFYTNPEGRGIVFSLRYGFSKARGNILVWMDCNLKHPPEVIPAMIQALREQDIVKASRYILEGGDQSEFFRKWTAYLVNKLAYWTLGGVHDYSSGFVAIRRDVLKKVPLPQKSHHGDYLVEFLYKAHKQGMRIQEIPYVMQKRGASKSKAKLLDPLYYFFTILKVKERVDRS